MMSAPLKSILREVILPGVVLALAPLSISSCTTGSQNGAEDQASTEGGTSEELAVDHVAGIQWVIPTRWEKQGERPLRVSTYFVPRVEGDVDDAECAVYYFGEDQGGDVESNLERWFGQFEQPDGSPSREAADRSSWTTNGIAMHNVYVEGTYLGMRMPSRPDPEPKSNYAMLATIAEGPQGRIFFKFVGPKETVISSREEFMFMVGSVDRFDPEG